ncbi:IclR family transcriptional regulator [Rhizocola hellebori]|uniref:IclR family transcriptional regulator n=1 Tax=Rhizocola hellebori TaxID=1392758 RepID=A0A8J3QIX4_9ACTN|nr:IclR family transcriptional regulator [Rhizocola hellebori]GIH10535.1 IclR family transcriptional regulator [Rhizocola hellebori]
MTANGSAGNAIEKALSVLEALADHERITDLAETTGLPKSTVHRILQSLVGHGFATSDGNGGYLPGPRALTLSGKIMHRLDPARLASPALNALRDRTGYTVHLALRNGDEAVYVEKLTGHKPYEMPSRIGQSLLLHSTAIGKAILAALSDEEVAAICRRTGMPRRSPHTMTSPTDLIAHLAEIRHHGYAIDDEEDVEGLRCIGAAVTGNHGQVVGAVSISTLVHELPPRETRLMGTEVLTTAREISLALGAP